MICPFIFMVVTVTFLISPIFRAILRECTESRTFVQSTVPGCILMQVGVAFLLSLATVSNAFNPPSYSAFGAPACLLAEYKHLSKEMALADSLTTDGEYFSP